MNTERIIIPRKNSNEVQKLAQSIHPIVRKDGQPYFLRELTEKEIFKDSFLSLNIEENYLREANLADLCVLKELRMLHEYSHFNTFKPTVSEIIRQIPKDLQSSTIAFEMIWQPTSIADFHLYREELDLGYHVSFIRLFQKRIPTKLYNPEEELYFELDPDKETGVYPKRGYALPYGYSKADFTNYKSEILSHL